MAKPSTEQRALSAIQRHGALLVYPIENRRQPPSLWHELYPRSDMRWAWDEHADPRVVSLWHVRESIARSRHAVYGKWYKGRATFFSRALFAALLASLRPEREPCSEEAREILRMLDEDSPQSSKRLRQAAGLSGRAGERVWVRAMDELWRRLLIVGTGEVDDGAFPSLAVGATRWMFEELWEAREHDLSEQQRALVEHFAKSAFGRYWRTIAGHGGQPSRPNEPA